MFITRPEAFAEWFNEKYPGTSRRITTEDVNEMTACRLIHRCGYYSKSIDGEIIRAVLQYEQMCEKRIERLEERGGRDEAKVVINRYTCKRCCQPLPVPPPEKKGRRREYCEQCEPFRCKERNRKWRRKKAHDFGLKYPISTVLAV